MKLNRYNYEEYFILYMDNELSDEDRREVELFVQQNPDLKSELDILLQSRLTPDTDISFTDKTSLMMFGSAPINMTNYEEWLLSYIDDELTDDQRKEVEQFIADKPALQKELSLFQKTKLQREEAVVFPGKESLYRREEKAKVIAIGWRRIAIAAALLFAVATTVFVVLNTRSKKDNDGTLAGGKVKTEIPAITQPSDNDKKVTPAQQPENIAPQNDGQVAVTTPMRNESSLKDKEPKKGINKANDQNNLAIEKDQSKEIKKEEKENGALAVINEPRKGNDLPDPTSENKYVNDPTKSKETITGTVDSDVALTNSPKKTDIDRVTSETQKASSIQNEASGKIENNPDAHFASNNEGKSNKGIRGFLRKVTRTFEKRTNIKATDDDDRLLIAGLAIKLN